MQAELFANVSAVIAHGVDTQIQHLGNLLARLAVADLFQHFFFAARQRAIWAHQSTGTQLQYERGQMTAPALACMIRPNPATVKKYSFFKKANRSRKFKKMTFLGHF